MPSRTLDESFQKKFGRFNFSMMSTSAAPMHPAAWVHSEMCNKNT
jgi:hypothetical protein